MDPLSQGVLGAAAAQSARYDKNTIRWVFFLGLLAGMAPDLDVLIQSHEDPLLYLEFHRQFTHSLIFIPLGGLIVGSLFYFLFKQWHALSFKQTWLFASLGYGTHGLLDACTSYGTQLLWPFTNTRFAWNNISIIDPLFTLPILALLIAAFIKRKPIFSRFALAYAVLYLSFGFIQHNRAEALLLTLADERGHTPIKYSAKPGFANLFLWKLIYEYEGRYYVDAARVGFDNKVIEGESIEKLVLDKHLPWLDKQSVQAKDIERFRWFSDDYLSMHPQLPFVVVDMRYSIIPNEIKPLWGIVLNPEKQSQHVDFVQLDRGQKEERQRYFNLLFDRNNDPNPER